MNRERKMNYFYIYAFMWSIILFLYSLGWSNLCTPLEPSLVVFFFVTIILSLVLGKIFKKYFEFKLLKKVPEGCGRFTKYIVLITILEVLYSREVPLLSIVFRSGNYGATGGGIPVIHPLVVSFGFFYAQYIFYCFLSHGKHKKLIVHYALILICIYLIWFGRMGLVMSLLVSGVLWIKSHKFTVKQMGAGVVLLLLVVYLFGVMGNVRSGYKPFDCSLIQVFGEFNEKYPKWLPKEFMWAYTYIIGPVATFNYNVQHFEPNFDLIGLLSTFMPDFIEKRLFVNYMGSNLLSGSTLIKVIVGMGEPYEYAGMFGVYLMYLWTAFVPLFILRVFKIQKKFYIPMQAIFVAIIVFMFYVNTWWYSGISFALVYPILLKRKITLNHRELVT